MKVCDLTKEVLEELYLREKKTEQVIADMYETSQVKIGRLRRAWGIPKILKSDRVDLPELSGKQKEFLVGSLLGDGWMTRESAETAKFHVGHSIKQSAYLSWKIAILGDFVKTIYDTEKRSGSGVYRGKCLSTYTHRQLYPWYTLFYPEGRRQFPSILEEMMTPFVLSIWYMDDGGLMNTYHPRITFGLDDESLRNALRALEKLGLHPTVHSEKRGSCKTITFPGQADKFFEIIKPYIPEAMQYKQPPESSRRDVDKNAKLLTMAIAQDLYEGGSSVKEIARSYGVGESTVRRRLSSKGVGKRMGRPQSLLEEQESEKRIREIAGLEEWRDLSKNQQEEKVQQVVALLKKTTFPYPKRPGDIGGEFEKLKRLVPYVEEGFIKPRSFQGLSLCSAFFPNRYQASSGSSKSAYEMWCDVKELERGVRFQLKVGDPVLPKRVLKALTMNARTPTIFRPGVAKYVYQTYCPEGGVVYDPCSGYGGRMLGALSTGVSKYIGTDVEEQTIQGNLGLAKAVGGEGRVSLHCMPQEDFVLPQRSVDLVFTSPPYYIAEKYSKQEMQSYRRYASYEEWLEGFLGSLVKNAWVFLKERGFLVLNMSDVKRGRKTYPLEKDAQTLMEEKGFEKIDLLKMPLGRLNRGRGFEPIFVYQKP